MNQDNINILAERFLALDLRAGLRRHFPIGYATRGSQRDRGSWWPTVLAGVGILVLWGVL